MAIYKALFHKIIFTFFLFSFLFSCSQEQESFKLNVEWITKSILGKNIEIIKTSNLFEDYSVKDTVLSYEDVSWNGIIISKNNENLVLFETNWAEKSKIKRIVIISEKITTQKGIHINSKFAELKQWIDDKNLNSQPDGFLGLKDKKDDRITYMLDITNTDELFYGAESIDKIPDELVVSDIIITSYK